MSNDFYQATFASPTNMPSIGLFREGKYLVVDLTHHQFPDRCLKTDMPISDAHTLVELRTYNVNGDELNLVRGLQVASTNRILTINETNKGNNVIVPLGVPLAPAMAVKLTSPYPLIFVILSILFTIGCFAGAIALTNNANLFISLIVGCILGVVMMIGGFVMMTLRTSRVLSIKRLADGKVWLRGVHADWLSRLPEYRISPELLQRDYKRAVSSTWWSFGTAIVFGIATLVCAPFAIQGYYHGMASRDWPSAEGKIGNVSISAHRSRRSRWWHVNFAFTFQVEGKTFGGKGYEKEHSAEAAEANAQRKPPGTPVTVFYSPRNPVDNRVERGLSNAEITWIVAAVVVSVIAFVAFCYGLVARSRAGAYKDQIDGVSGPPAFGHV